MPGPAALASAASSAISGIRQASSRQDAAAVEVARSFHPELKAPASPGGGAGSPAATVQVSNEAADLAGAYVDMMNAKSETTANVKVLNTVDEMSKELTHIIG